MITPHGGVLVERYLSPVEAEEFKKQLGSLARISLDEVELSDLRLIANGAFSPLTGFLNQDDYHSVLTENRLQSGIVWTIPITLSILNPESGSFQVGDRVALFSEAKEWVGILFVESVYRRDREAEAVAVYGTTDQGHPGVAYLFSKGEFLLGGSIKAVKTETNNSNPELELTPQQTRAEFSKRGWKSIVAFQTRNPIHRAHEYLQKVALEMVDGLLIHPLVGFTKPGDIPAEVRMECYQKLIKEYYPANRVLLSAFPAAMRYAGPKEAVFHAIVRQNYGCTHFIVGRDHAGVGSYYGSYDAQAIFDQFAENEIGITILKFENTFFCKRCGSLASSKTCPHRPEDQVYLSGTKVREMLSNGIKLPPEFTRPEISMILMEYYLSISSLSKEPVA